MDKACQALKRAGIDPGEVVGDADSRPIEPCDLEGLEPDECEVPRPAESQQERKQQGNT
jgi:serine O-acetyltransferase